MRILHPTEDAAFFIPPSFLIFVLGNIQSTHTHRSMEIQLDRFEEQIDEVILQRGLNYFRKGYVTNVEEIGHGDYEATVEGTDTYTVHLHVEEVS